MTLNRPFYADGLAFECTRCSNCCRHDPGYVFLSRKDLDTLCRHTGLNEAQFKEKYCRVVNFGIIARLSLTEKRNNDCVFWEGEGCSVYGARPLQCRAFPFWVQNVETRDGWESAAEDCPGMNRGKTHDRAAIEVWLKARLDEPLLEE
jgi:Fe-S-cluster containining protein